MEQYLWTMRTSSEEEKVSLATMYLRGDAKLWWRVKCEDVKAGLCHVDTWEDLRKELEAQFLPENVGEMARRKLRDLRQTGTIREYVKAFAAIMLDLRGMDEADKLFQFKEGLQPWARNELQRRGVKDLAAAQATVERLEDFSRPNVTQQRPQ